MDPGNPSGDNTEDSRPAIGEQDEYLRVLSFSGSGLDSIMQLGVAHALLVSRGKAPQMVVGVSAGAVQAVALAEILQAGDREKLEAAAVAYKSGDAAEFDRLYDEVLRARVKKFRELLECSYEAPERLFDAAIPGAFQINSNDPLEPLEAPRFAKFERDARRKDVIRKAGLSNLYNDLLKIHVPLGTLVRFVRRLLGLRAVGELKFVPRWLGRITELSRLWLLAGHHIHRFVQPTRILADAINPLATRTRPGSAGRLIFRFPFASRLTEGVKNFVAFQVPSLVWLGVSLLPIVLAMYALQPVQNFFADRIATGGQQDFATLWTQSATAWGATVTVAMAAIMAVALLRNTLGDLGRSLLQFTWIWLKWFLVNTVLWFVVFIVLRPSGMTLPVLYDLVTPGLRWLTSLPVLSPISDLLFGFVSRPVECTSQLSIFGEGYFLCHVKTILGTLLVIGVASMVLLIASIVIFYAWPAAKRTFFPGEAANEVRFSAVLNKILKHFSLNESLLHPHDLEYFYHELFDRNYYGNVTQKKVIEESIKPNLAGSALDGVSIETIVEGRKTIAAYYEDACQPIAVGLAYANLASRRLEVFPQDGAVVDGLLSATARPPWLPAWPGPEKRQAELRSVDKNSVFVDGSSITNVPTRALLEMLRERFLLEKYANGVHLYSVSPLPLSRELFAESNDPETQPESSSSCTPDIVDVTVDSIGLTRFRDAGLEKRVTELYTEVIPEAERDGDRGLRRISRIDIERGESEAGGDRRPLEYYRVFVSPVELDTTDNMHRKVMGAGKQVRRDLLNQIIADGCRQAMQAFVADEVRDEKTDDFVACGHVVRARLEKADLGFRSDAHQTPELPGSVGYNADRMSPDAPPGLREICAHCKLKKPGSEETFPAALDARETSLDGASTSWPFEFGSAGCEPCASSRSEGTSQRSNGALEREEEEKRFYDALRRVWPARPSAGGGSETPVDRPTTSLLFSGGVFRGVFQIGVINALRETGAKPDIVAGASVGAITAAAASRVLAATRSESDDIRGGLDLALLAATYLSVDRIILTDRFANFVREITVRASDARFSVREIDQLLRNYDQSGVPGFGQRARQVVAGLERLFFVTPFQLHDLVKSMRAGDTDTAVATLRMLAQQWLDNSGVGRQVLGAESLELLIDAFVTQGRSMSINELDRLGTHFICTTTDLSTSKLVRLGLPPDEEHRGNTADLKESLLASSAFLGVFRPRRLSNLFPPGFGEQRYYVDGGALDNLPVRSIIRMLREAEAHRLIRRRPANPHMVFAASLEPDIGDITEPKELQKLKSHWPALVTRSRQMQYNLKLHLFEKAIDDRQRIYLGTRNDARYPKNVDAPLYLRLVSLKPRWLSGTFAFHPMLGYRRETQARSIAHGCASTLVRLNNELDENLTAWQIDKDKVPGFDSIDSALKQPGKGTSGQCWLRPGQLCTFSKEGLECLNKQAEKSGHDRLKARKLNRKTIEELSQIHKVCSQAKTHGASQQ